MRKWVVAFSLLCLTLVMVYASAMAQGEDVLVKPYTWDPATIVYSDQNIILSAGWTACRRGAIQSFLTATEITWTLQGDSLDYSGEDTSEYWQRPYSVPAFPASETCMGRTPDNMWSTSWGFPIGNLPAGTYSLYFHWWLDHPVTDVADYDGDGTPDLFEGTIRELTTTIHVIDR